MSLDNPKYWRMVKRKTDQSLSNRQEVFLAIEQIAKPSTSTEIFTYIRNKKLLQCKKEFTSHIQMDDESSENKELHWIKICRQKMITLRTVQRQLRILTEQGFLVCERRCYYFTDVENLPVKMHAKEFGTALLYSAMKRICPHYSRLEYNVTRLVEILGVYLVYCFLEAAKPLSGTSSTRDGRKRDELAISWTQSMLDPVRMFYYFVTLAKTQLSDESVRQTRKRHFKKKNDIYEFKGDLEEFTCSLAKFMMWEVGRHFKEENSKKNYNTRNSILECEPEFIDKVKQVLNNRYEMVYQEIENSYNLFSIRNKNGSKAIGPKNEYPRGISYDGVWNSEILEAVPEWDGDLKIKRQKK